LFVVIQELTDFFDSGTFAWGLQVLGAALLARGMAVKDPGKAQ
jgi:hypothetical protein